MTWTYTSPLTSRKDEVRFLIGDTNADEDEQLLQDEEIDYSLALYSVPTDVINLDTTVTIDRTRQPLMAAVICAEAIWSRFQRQANEQLPPVNFEYADRAKNYRVLVDDLRMKAIVRGQLTPFVGGMDILDKVINREDESRVEPEFRKHMNDNFNSTTGLQNINLLDID